MEPDPTVLVALCDDERRDWLVRELAADGYDCAGAGGRREAELKARNRPPEVLLVGALGRPLDQLELVRAIRHGAQETHRIDPRIGLIALGDRGGELEAVRLLDAGADDYLEPPPGYPELRARIAALRRRLSARHGARKRLGALDIDPHGRSASYAGRPLALSRSEFELLNRLACEPTRTVPKRELLEQLWGYPPGTRSRTVEAHACRLRRRLTAAGARGVVVCVRGVGYRLTERLPIATKPARSEIAA